MSLVSLVIGIVATLAVLQLHGGDDGAKGDRASSSDSRWGSDAERERSADAVDKAIDDVEAALPDTTAPRGALDRAGYQKFLDYVRTEVGVAMAREVTDGSRDAQNAAQTLRVVADAMEPGLVEYRAVQPPAHVRAAHDQMVAAMEDYQEALRLLAADPETAALGPDELPGLIAELPEVRAMWQANAAIEAQGYVADKRG